MSLWRKHRHISLQEHDDIDSLAAGSQFLVKCVGSTYVNGLEEKTGLEEKKSKDILFEFYKDLLELFQCEHGSLLRLIVDLSGAIIYNKDGDILQRFQLSDIRDVMYTTKKVEYSRYFLLVGREESEQNIKAHVLFCEDKHKAKLLYDTFIQVFSLGAEMKKYERQVSDSRTLKNTSQKPRINSETTTSSKRHAEVNRKDSQLKMPPRRQTWDNSSMTRPPTQKLSDIAQKEIELNDSFTKLARSRSSSSGISLKLADTNMNGNKILWQQDSDDVFK